MLRQGVRAFSVYLFLILVAACGTSGPEATPAPPAATAAPTPDLPTPSPVPPTATPALRSDSAHDLGDVWTRPTDGIAMVYVPPGDLQMGSTEAEIEAAIALCREHYTPCNNWYYEREGPAHAVSVDGFWLDQAEVTNAQYGRCVDGGACSEPLTCKKGKPTYGDPEKSDHPVVCAAWEDARAYCEWAGARLPTEAEWEYAFRGQQGSIFPWGDTFDGSRLNYCDANCSQPHADGDWDDGYATTGPAGAWPLDASWCGATGMGGNVSEWVADWYGEYSAGDQSNPEGPESGKEKMLKGCSWYSPSAYCRGAARPSVDPSVRFDYLGFRCARSADGEAAAPGLPSAAQAPIQVPQGPAAVLDGVLNADEWASARRERFSDGSELLLMHADGYLFLGIRASTPDMIAANIHLGRSGEISILHSSAALGTAVYRKGAGAWDQVREFSWSCRATGQNEAARAERAAFQQTEGWVAANSRMGTPNELEYQIQISEEPMVLAAVFLRASDVDVKIAWPADLDDDCVKPTPGGLPAVMDFSPERWGALSFASKEAGQ